MAAVGSERLAKTLGWLIKKGNFSNTTPNLPMNIAILAQANTANQSDLTTARQEITSAKQAGELYGWGSPIFNIMSMLRPQSGGVGGIPTYVYPQVDGGGFTVGTKELTITGTATGSGVHRLRIAGRYFRNSGNYNITIAKGDTASVIYAKIATAVNAVLEAPCVASVDSPPTMVEFTTKWAGSTSNIDIRMDVGSDDLGLTYTFATGTSGAGVPSVSGSLALFGSTWHTLVINSYGLDTTVMDELELFNGVPDDENPTGRYAGIVAKPFIALCGTVLDNPSSITDARKTQCTNVAAPAPFSLNLSMEVAAAYCLQIATLAQDNPHLDAGALSKVLVDISGPTAIPAMTDYNTRDAYVKKGCSTVDVVNDTYVLSDIVTTYHPVGEYPAQFSWVRNLICDWNQKFIYYDMLQLKAYGFVIVKDGDTVSAPKTLKPNQLKALISNMAADLGNRALITDVEFMQNSIVVVIDSNNPDRLNPTWRYKRSGVGRIISTEATAGFQTGTI